ncbi:hypothetical protein FBUS_03067 [Fasciolopsis buskii]|uniref:Uncharacterized protein n=1 Tax=Fasciolopsis buskii TaxID=27845 RepID=A0A8E0RYX9_9TREM|nr:hypothetical protein FBUS_03067 [Fasciolopsis buski]
MQAILDAQSCFWNIIHLWVRRFPFADPVTGWIQCHVWLTQAPYWLIVAMSTSNITWITLDCLWATVYSGTYFHNEGVYISWTSFGTLIFGLVLVIPVMMVVELENSQCIMRPTAKQPIAYAVNSFLQPYWIIIFYLLPVLIMMVAHFRVVLYQYSASLKQQTDNPENEPPNWSHPFDLREKIFVSTPSKSAHDPTDPLFQSLIVGSRFLTMAVVLSHTYDTVLYLMSKNVEGYAYDVGSDVQMVSVFVTTLNCIIDPIIIALSVPSVRRSTIAYVSLAVRNCQSVFKINAC